MSASEELQDVLDAVLFEPAQWKSENFIKSEGLVPSPNRELMATPCGLLFNELQKSPNVILKSIDEMIDFALELDTGKYTSSSAPVILYVIRLAVRVEEYMLFLIRHGAWANSPLAQSTVGDIYTGCGWASHVRGLDVAPEILELLKSKQQSLRDRLDTVVYPMLDKWTKKATKVRNGFVSDVFCYETCSVCVCVVCLYLCRTCCCFSMSCYENLFCVVFMFTFTICF